MEHIEMVEKLRERANVSYEEAKNALEACDWDLLDALVLLENEGKTREKPQEDYTTKPEEDSKQTVSEFKSRGRKFCDFVTNLIKKGNANRFTVTRKQEELFRLPVTVLVLLLILAWPYSVIALVIGLFLGCRYRFSGPDIGDKLNSAMDKAADAVQKDKKEE